MDYTLSKEVKNSGIVNIGNVSKIIEVFKKAERGEDITVAFLGGSITQQFKAEVHEKCYAYLTYLWFKENFKSINVKYINAGVGATGSIIGVHRVEREVLKFNPDILFVDFAVNDKVDDYCKVSYESLIRKILSWKKVPALIEVFMSNDDFSNAQKQQINIGEKYNLPMISYRNVLKSEIEKGSFKWKDVEADEVHPNNNGHYILNQLLVNFLEEVRSGNIKGNNEETKLGEALYGDKYINGVILNNKNAKCTKNEGFEFDTEGFQVFNNGWKLIKENKGELEFEIEGKNIFLLYRKSIDETSGKICIRANDKDVVLDTFFKDGWGDYAETYPIIEGKEKAKHKITIKADKKIFIMGFLVS
ncbi:MAG: SGNH/GDSL hydrolase family protein [Clostridium sp.]|uniref:SGNH/GDSL hydrolase family protein n=1 Tax=Clostridium sp. DSM 8431 TaxID=1761781 RepID=UPI0008E812D9|nr:SGNH/GDSL hydrolase family protein [Clostridium sp. DSM 8431]MCR4943803.1 SGNH/GDSL hydrolase family protein [Clostridium sp.]SFU56208.1 Lysophospholipase L1 [Clostridium sp. DSM 8431]